MQHDNQCSVRVEIGDATQEELILSEQAEKALGMLDDFFGGNFAKLFVGLKIKIGDGLIEGGAEAFPEENLIKMDRRKMLLSLKQEEEILSDLFDKGDRTRMVAMGIAEEPASSLLYAIIHEVGHILDYKAPGQTENRVEFQESPTKYGRVPSKWYLERPEEPFAESFPEGFAYMVFGADVSDNMRTAVNDAVRGTSESMHTKSAMEEDNLPSDIESPYFLFRTPNEVQAVYDERHQNCESGKPYLVEINKAGQRITFFGSTHVNVPNHAEIGQIENKWDEFLGTNNQKKVAMCEGRLRPVDEQTREQMIVKHSETGLVCWLADRDGIEPISPEPEISEEVDHLHANGFSFEQIINYYFARQMHQWIKRDRANEADWRKYITDGLEKFNSIHDWGGLDINLDSLMKIYKQQTGQEFSIDDEESLYKISDPYQNPIAAASGRLRDEKLFKTIVERWNRGFDIFVVYGSSHAIVLEPALEELSK